MTREEKQATIVIIVAIAAMALITMLFTMGCKSHEPYPPTGMYRDYQRPISEPTWADQIVWQYQPTYVAPAAGYCGP